MPEKILEMSSATQFKRDYTRYGIYILYRRVLSDYRDGLKPVQRRILWAMLKNTKAINSTVKSAAVVGDVMKLYHPHGDCKHPDTLLYTLDNKTIRIEDVYKSGIGSLEILAVDQNGKVVPAIATNFRIGQYSDTEYRIHLSNGYIDISTGNHPYLTESMEWIKAQDLKPNTRLYCRTMRFNHGRQIIDGNYLYHHTVHDYYYGISCDGPESLSKLFNTRKEEFKEFDNANLNLIEPMEFYIDYRGMVYNIFDRMLSNGIELTIKNYYNFVQKRNSSTVNESRLAYLINLYRIEKPYVDYVECAHVENTPYYDFTVNGLENMLIPVNNACNTAIENQIGTNIPFICIHNSSIYGTMKPMANWFETYVPLIDKNGNFGTFQGDPQAAARYTECKLSKFSLEAVLADIIDSPESVDWSATYNEATKEPDYLPVKVPLLLINGSFGIGLGMRAEIPTHNLVEVIDATLALMDNPNIEITLIPDHCMPCEIINTDFTKICRAGFGHYKVRGKIDIEQYKGKTALIIKSVPNLTFLNSVTEKIEDLVKKKKIIQIDSWYDESTEDMMRYVIVLKPGSDPNYVRDVIYKNTTLEQTLRINFETLNGLNPLRLSYKSYLLSFIDFRKMTKFRVYSNRLQVIQTKIHEREAYIKVLESGEIDNIIAIIKKQKVVNDVVLIEYLIKKLKITDLQAKYIIESDLKKLSYGYLSKYKEEAKELEASKKELLMHIMDDKIIENDIRQELLEIKAKYGKPRNCTIIDENAASEIPKGEMTVAISEKNFIRKVPGNAAIGSFKNDNIRTMIKLDNTDSILIFDEMGKVFKLPVHKIPFTDKNSNGTDIRFLIKSLTANINTIIPESIIKNLAGKGQHNNKHYVLTLSNSGLIKRMDLDDFVTVPPSGIMYAKVDKGDFIKDIVIAHSSFRIVVYSDRKAVIMGVNDISYLKRNTKGSKAMSNVDHVDGMCVLYNGCTDIVVITESGRINRINVIQGLPNTAKGKSGSNLIKLASGDKIVSVVSGNECDLVHIQCTDTDTVFKIADLKIGSSISPGDKVLATRGNKIIRCWAEKYLG